MILLPHFVLLPWVNLFIIHQPVDRILQGRKISTTQPNIPSHVPAIPAPSHTATHGTTSTDPEQTPNPRPGSRRSPSHSHSSSSGPTSPHESENIPGLPRDCIAPLINIGTSLNAEPSGSSYIAFYLADAVHMAIKRCSPDRGNILRNLAKDINTAVEACAPERDNLLFELKNAINMAIKASVPESDNLLKGLVNKINAAIGTSASERDNYLRNLANDVEMAIEAGAPPGGNSPMNPLDLRDWASSGAY